MPHLPSLRIEPTRYPGCCFSLSNPLLQTIRSLLESSHEITNSTNLAHSDKRSHDWDAFERGRQADRDPALILSIGSGTGLLEELLHLYLNVDVQSPPEAPVRLDNSPPGPDHAGTSSIRPQHVASQVRPLRKSWRVEGVEVNLAVNIYLPEDRINHVPGTWAVLETRAREASALMFVYPRDGALVRRYVDAFMRVPIVAKDERTSGDQRTGGRSGGSDSDSDMESESLTAGERMEGIEKEAPEGEEQRTSRRGGRLVFWLGPKCDWEDTGLGSCDARGGLEILEIRDDAGLVEYEMLATLRRKATASISAL